MQQRRRQRQCPQLAPSRFEASLLPLQYFRPCAVSVGKAVQYPWRPVVVVDALPEIDAATGDLETCRCITDIITRFMMHR